MFQRAQEFWESRISHEPFNVDVHHTFESNASIGILLLGICVCLGVTFVVIQFIAVFVGSSGVALQDVARVASMFNFLRSLLAPWPKICQVL